MSTQYPGGIITKNTITPTPTSASGIWTLDQQMQAQKAGIWPFGGPFNYIEDVFSTWLYTGTGATQTITNGIDLSGSGGLAWIKWRSGGGLGSADHCLFDTQRGVENVLFSNSTASQNPYGVATGSLTAFNSNGFSLGSDATYGRVNTSGGLFASWTFRKQPKFFDVVTYTGTGSNTTIAHNLGSVPACIIVKRTDTTADWQVYHRSLANTEYLVLNSTAAKATGATRWNSTTPTSTVFSLGTDATVNASGGTYVAYLFAHDAGGFGLTGTDNVISCGSYTGTSAQQDVSLGFEPQWLMIKNATTSGNDWLVVDNMRAFTLALLSDAFLRPNLSDAETFTNYVAPLATGFQLNTSVQSVNQTGSSYIYIAIRRGPMKVPTSGTSVFQPVTYTGTNVDNRLVNTGIVTDMTMARIRTATSAGGFYTADRLRGNPYLGTAVTSVEDADADSFMTPTVGYGNSFSAMNGFGVGNDVTRQLNQNNTSQLAYAFQRAPNFFDVVCYTGTGSSTTITHNLTVAPELLFVKARSNIQNWSALCTLNSGLQGRLNTTDALSAPSAAVFGNGTSYVAPTASVFTVGTDNETNASTWTYVAYLFATCPGLSKVGTYTGTGSTQTINCGFVGGARFVLIKSVTTAQGWYVWDTARGMVAGTDLSLQLQSVTAEQNDNFVYTATTGFQIVTGNANFNASGVTYLFLAIA